MEILHLTSEENWKSIQNSGYLLPKSDPNASKFHISRELEKLMPFKEYLVGIPIEGYQGWIDCELENLLLTHTSGEVKLKLSTTYNRISFIRDHALLSNGRLKKEKGIDIFGFQEKLMDEEYCSTKTCKKLKEIIEEAETIFRDEYLNSSISLEDYKGQYKAPEVWLPQITPVDSIKRLHSKTII